MKQALVFILLLCLMLPGCSGEFYCEDDFLGKTSAQIIAEFGEFDCTGKQPDSDGVYRSTSCGYTVREPRKGFFGTKPEEIFFISFDENGIAVGCYEGVRGGG